jgi:pimeloyl-ACP methyl ester carboxylesterase
VNTSARSNKSTNVRTQSVAIRAAKAGFRVLSPHAPRLAARWAERLFLSARRYERPYWEAESLSSATAGRVPYESGWLPTWTWSPEGSEVHIEEPRTILLVHGWEGRGSQLAAFVPELVQRGFRVVTFDAPGHGDSPLARASVVDHARALRAVATAIGPVHAVIGHSVGGAATLLATRYGLKADRIALVASPTTPAGWAAGFAKMLGLDDAVKEAMIARIEARYDVRFDELDVRTDARKLAAPLLVVHDREDPVVAFQNGVHLANDAPLGELAEVSGLGHRAILRAAHVIAKVVGFVDDGTPRNFTNTLDGELFVRELRWRSA